MSKELPLKKILVVDDEIELAEFFKLKIEAAYLAEVTLTHSGKAAIEELEKNPNYACVVCDYYMPKGNGGAVFNYIEKSRLKIPFYLVSAAPPQDYPEFIGKNITGYLVKPEINGIVEMIKNSLGLNSENRNPYIPISINVLKRIKKLPFNCYLTIDKKYLLVHKSGSLFESTDCDKYEKKNIKSLLIKREDMSNVIRAIQFSSMDVENQTVDSVVDLVSATLDIAQQFIQTENFPAEVVEAIKNSAESLINVSKKDKRLSAYLNRLELHEDSYLGQHSSLIAYIACSIANYLTFESEFTHLKLTYAALLHDLTLSDQELENIESLMESKNDEFFLNHPVTASKALKHFRELPPDIDVIISQHHELPNGKGFPHQLNPNKISPLACVFIVAEDFADYVIKQKQKSAPLNTNEYLSFCQKKYNIGKFQTAFEGLTWVIERDPDLKKNKKAA